MYRSLLLLVLWLALVGVGVEPSRPSVLLLFSRPDNFYQEFATAFEQALATLPKAPRLLKAGSPVPAADLLVAVGLAACETALATTGSPPVLCALVSRGQATPWLEQTRRPATAVYIDQPWDRHFRLTRLALPKVERLGWVYGPTLQAEVPRVQQAARAAGLSLESLALQPGDNLSQRLDALLPKVDALLAPADPAVVRPDTAYALLLTTYHHYVPVIGYSKAFVNVGALVAVYATLAQQGLQAATLAAGILRTPGRPLPPPQLADAITVAVNPQVARSLNLVVPDAATLEKALSPSTDPCLK